MRRILVLDGPRHLVHNRKRPLHGIERSQCLQERVGRARRVGAVHEFDQLAGQFDTRIERLQPRVVPEANIAEVNLHDGRAIDEKLVGNSRHIVAENDRCRRR